MPPKKAAAAKAAPPANVKAKTSTTTTKAKSAISAKESKAPIETATTTKSVGTKRKAPETSVEEEPTAKTMNTNTTIIEKTSKALNSKVKKSVAASKPKAPAPAPVPQPSKTSVKKRVATKVESEDDSEDNDEEPPAKKRKIAAAVKSTTKSVKKIAASKVAKKAPGSNQPGATKTSTEPVDEDEEDERSWSERTIEELKTELKIRGLVVSGKKVDLVARLEAHDNGETTGLAPAPKKPAASKAAPKKKALADINRIPTQKLDIYVFGEGTAGELGLGGVKYDGNKKPIDVSRPRLNHRLSAKDVGVVQIAVGGMHCAALTHDNKILTWGVNDQGALGRVTGAAKDKVIEEKDSDNSDSEDDDDDYLNPTESEPREVDSAAFPEGTKFSQLAASDSATFALTSDGSVYGWGTFRANDGILGFLGHKDVQFRPVHIHELKKIVSISCGTNHVLALTEKGKVFTWGAGEQNQLARRVVARTASGALVPREFGLGRKTITKIACGDYHSFAVDKDNNVYAWGLNTFGQTGVPKSKAGTSDEDTIITPTKVESLKGKVITDIDGGAHHTISCTEEGEVLVWGRIDGNQGGRDRSKFSKDDVYFDERGDARFLINPVAVENITNAKCVSAGPDACLVVTKEGQAYSWGFSANYQTGQGTVEDVVDATLFDNTAVRGKKLVFCGAGGQFGILAGEHKDLEMTNGI